ncbi:ditrans,polycis-polyprenyl diphosphate synthase [Bulinus truncatus]|nr:ditrans,polycis-polyprenyl diphosphate synthase [Bulinus truncatus]
MASSSSDVHLKCRFTSCTKKLAITGNDTRVQVKAFQPKSPLHSATVHWQDGGLAVFHYDCWKTVLHATKNSEAQSQLHLSDTEKDMILEAKKTAEYFDSTDKLKTEAAQIAEIVRKSQYCIAFTGAGISTAAGIGDFRGLEGKWTNMDKKKLYGAESARIGSSRKSLIDLRPTYTHEALCKLLEMKHLKFIISQNTDGLHLLSGVHPEQIAELHGNSFVEKCEKCHTRFERTFGVRMHQLGNCPPKPCPKCNINHRTGRKCSKSQCDGCLMNTIINFGDHLETPVLRKAEIEAEKADAVLILGSTLLVSPANDLVTRGPQPNRLIICNRQITPYDKECFKTGKDGKQLGSRVFGNCDDLMREVMQLLMSSSDLDRWEEEIALKVKEYEKKRRLDT